MKKIILLGTFVSILFASCNYRGSGNIITQNRTTGTFTGINVDDAIQVEIIQSNETKIVVSGDDNFINYVNTKINNGILEISLKGKPSFSNYDVSVVCYTPNINLLQSDGASSIFSNSIIKNENNLVLDADGASTIELEVDAPNIKAQSDGASTIKLAGKSKALHFVSDGASNINAFKLLSETCTADADGASNIKFTASVSAEVSSDGASSIKYKGKPTINKRNVEMASSANSED